MQRILIIEDDARIASLLRTALDENGYAPQVAYDGNMGWRLFCQGGFDLVISDIILPGIDGMQLSRKIREQDKLTPILMLTALGTTDDKLDGFDAGADKYMVKPFDLRELLARIRVLLRRSQMPQVDKPEVISVADLVIDLRGQNVTRGTQTIRLTPKEYNLLRFLAENAGRVVSRTEIAEKVWNTRFDTGTNFIDVYINYLRRKIDRDYDVKLLHTRPGMGFILTDEP